MEEYKFNPPSMLPPVGTPLVIEVAEGETWLVERTGYVETKDSEMEYQTSDGFKIVGRFPWTYP